MYDRGIKRERKREIIMIIIMIHRKSDTKKIELFHQLEREKKTERLRERETGGKE